MQFCNIAPPEKVLQYCNTSILFTERKPIIHKFDFAYLRIYWKTLVPKSLSRDFNRFLTEFWWYLQVYLNFSNFPIQFYIWKTKKQCHFLKYCVSILLNFLQYCTTAILHFWKIMQYCKNPEKVLQYWNAILQYCNTESLIYWYIFYKVNHIFMKMYFFKTPNTSKMRVSAWFASFCRVFSWQKRKMRFLIAFLLSKH